jgi:hypothetical protein
VLGGELVTASAPALPQDAAAAACGHALPEAVHPLAVAALGLIGTFDGSDLLRTKFLYPNGPRGADGRGANYSGCSSHHQPSMSRNLRPWMHCESTTPLLTLAVEKRTTGIPDTIVQQNSQFTTLHLS